ncbi:MULTISPECIES: O-antigen translocase [unclassified Leeuwenhoekiella]|uniref:O-antigen translocase n=1 Tax=unclassified Leeuwenhoekiella TaxID=2615029 RepID=UPI000C473520|nr:MULTISPECIES: O-antigen translocase [unclassified Leeuwenhoekiella]MAW94130.1 O-antigen flippase [Leeuwenhoekiella sp.]MBA82427.1 O-antigen flippase [Leeuwenhoekiella sp.]|tara:strand:+ start:31238 stop:32536 length:1299 start_codon:yes stop_codon:yes gene_type:complete
MLRFVRKLFAQNILLQVGSLNSLAIGVRVVCGLITSKLIAIYVGASGMAILGDLRNFMSSLQSLGQLGISNGVIKYAATYKKEEKQLRALVATVLKLPFLVSLGLGILVVIAAPQFNRLIFDIGTDFTTIIRLAGIALPLFTLQTLLLNILNGLGDYRRVIFINLSVNLAGMLLSVVLIIWYSLWGAMLAVVVAGILALGITLFFLRKYFENAKAVFGLKADVQILKKLGSYAFMSLFSAVAAPWVYIAIRQYIIATDGIEQAGYWDAMLRLSDYYLMFATSVLTLYVLPKLASATGKNQLRRVTLDFYKSILPFFALCLIAIFLLKGFIIRLVYDASFLEMRPIFIWQLAGDLIRVASLVIAYEIIAKNKVKTFVITQIVSLSIIYFSSVWLVSHYGFVGAGMAHLFSYSLYLLVLLGIFRKELFSRPSTD